MSKKPSKKFMESLKRNRSIRFTINETEFQIIRERARDIGWSTASFVRWTALSAHVPDILAAKGSRRGRRAVAQAR